MIRYCVVEETNTEKLEEKVNLLISQGWKPQGGISARTYSYQQAMIKEE